MNQLERFLKIGEHYVQWIALALGAAYLAYMAVFYIAQPPQDLTIQVNNKTVLPGEVDAEILQSPAVRTISKDIKSQDVPFQYANIQPLEAVRNELTRGGPVEVAALPMVVDFGPTSAPTPTVASGPPVIPVMPAAKPSGEAPSGGLAELMIPKPPAAVPAPAAGAAPAPPVEPVSAPEVRNWVCLGWTLHWSDIDKALKAARVPDSVARVTFLRVELVREEWSPAGKWINRQSVPFASSTYLAPLPPETAPFEVKDDYKGNAWKEQENILRPMLQQSSTDKFGVGWYPPGSPKPHPDVFDAPPAGAAGAAPAPAAPPVQPVQPVIPRRPLPNGIVPGRPAPGPLLRGMPGGPDPYDRTGGRPVGRPPAVARGYNPSIYQPRGPAATGANFDSTQIGYDPAQQISDGQNDIAVYTNDWTVQDGKIYRFQMRYVVVSPLFALSIASEKDRAILEAYSAYSVWSEPVAVPSRYKFFVQRYQERNQNNINQNVVFDVFKKDPVSASGVAHEQVQVSPGDAIGDAAIGDSGWLLVDVRYDVPRHGYFFLVTNPDGQVERRNVQDDGQNATYEDLKQRTGATAGASAIP